MERESFSNAEIAAIMNKYLVCIKVDREERPDLDQIYIAAVSAMTGSAGWPLNVFLTKFPSPLTHNFLLRYYASVRNEKGGKEKAKKALEMSLTKNSRQIQYE